MSQVVKSSGGELQAKGLGSYIPILICCLAFAFVPSAMQSGCLGIFLPELAKAFNTASSTISLYITLGNLAVAVTSLIVGQLLAKFDARVISSVLVILVALCFFGMASANAVWQIWICGAMLTATAVPLNMLVNPTLINRWFKDRAGFFIGLSSACIGLGSILFLQIGNYIIASLGYQLAYITYGVVVLVICLPLAIFVVRSHPEDRGLLPYTTGKTQAAAGSAHSATRTWNVDVNKCMKSPAFWLVGIVGGFFGMALLINPQWPTYINTLTGAGLTVLVTGAVFASIVSGSQVVGKLVVGTIGDSSPMKAILFASVLGIISMLAVWLAPTTFMLPLGAVFFGFYFSVSGVLLPLLARAVFGTGDSYSVLYGRALLITKLMTAPGAVIWPLVAENFGGYGAAFGCIICLIIVCCILAFLALKFGEKLPRVYSDGSKDDSPAKEQEAKPANA